MNPLAKNNKKLRKIRVAELTVCLSLQPLKVDDVANNYGLHYDPLNLKVVTAKAIPLLIP